MAVHSLSKRQRLVSLLSSTETGGPGKSWEVLKGGQGEVEGICPWAILGAVQAGGAQCFDKVCPGSARKSADKNFQKLFSGGVRHQFFDQISFLV